MKLNEEKKAAIKLINQYADQYNQKEAENKMLQIEIEDLKKTIKINKEIIEGFFNPEQKEKSKLYLKKTKEEIALLTQANANLRNDIKQFKDKIVYYEVLLNESILKYYNSTDALQAKIFSLDNVIKKKDAIICYLNLKLSSLYDSKYSGEACDKEIYILEPQTSVLLINSQLELEKDANERLLLKMKEQEANIETLQTEIEKHKEKEEESSYEDSHVSRLTIVKDNQSHPYNRTNGKPIATTDSIAEMVDENQPNWAKTEWLEILRSVHLTPESLHAMGKIDMYKNITEIIEVLVKTIMERNMQLRVLLKSNSELNAKNTALSNHMLSLKQDMAILKSEIKSLNKLRACNVSMIQNEKKNLELSLLEEKKSQYKHYEQYLEEFNSKSIRINDSIADEAVKECCKSFMTHESTIHKKGVTAYDVNNNYKNESFISETLFVDPINGGNNKPYAINPRLKGE